MGMLVVNVRVVRMAVGHGVMPVCMTVCAATTPPVSVRMLMVVIMMMFMLVFDHLVNVCMFMLLREV